MGPKLAPGQFDQGGHFQKARRRAAVQRRQKRVADQPILKR
jgi:hypothetical protein